MRNIENSPSTLEPGFTTYSPKALRALFGGRNVSHIFSGKNPGNDSADALRLK